MNINFQMSLDLMWIHAWNIYKLFKSTDFLQLWLIIYSILYKINIFFLKYDLYCGFISIKTWTWDLTIIISLHHIIWRNIWIQEKWCVGVKIYFYWKWTKNTFEIYNFPKDLNSNHRRIWHFILIICIIIVPSRVFFHIC